jgi:hypothetical protein
MEERLAQLEEQVKQQAAMIALLIDDRQDNDDLGVDAALDDFYITQKDNLHSRGYRVRT